MPTEESRQQALIAAMPAVFVAIWSTGFVVARLAMPHAPPLTFLCWRYVFSVLAFALWIMLAHVPLPSKPAQWGHLAVSGVLIHAGYLGGVWGAVHAGLSAGIAALIVGLQPLLTALWETQRGHQRFSRPQWMGLVLGLVGLVAVVWPKVGTGEITAQNLALVLLALLAITAGTLYQKQHVVPADVRAGNAVQLMAALLVTLPLAWFESAPMVWHHDVLVAMAWSVFGLSLGGSSLLMLLIQRGAASRVASLMYLVPPCTAVLAWWMFGEAMKPVSWAGLALCAVGVSLVLRRPVS